MEELELSCLSLTDKSSKYVLSAGDWSGCSQLAGQLALHPELKTTERSDLIRKYKGKRADGLESSCSAAVEKATDKLSDGGWAICSKLAAEIGKHPELNSPSKQEVLRQAAVKVMAANLKGSKLPPTGGSTTAQRDAEKMAGDLTAKFKSACTEPEKKCTAGPSDGPACLQTLVCMCSCMADNIPANHPEMPKLRKCAADATARINKQQPSNGE